MSNPTFSQVVGLRDVAQALLPAASALARNLGANHWKQGSGCAEVSAARDVPGRDRPPLTPTLGHDTLWETRARVEMSLDTADMSVRATSEGGV